ncbi:hypothetical protein [Pseudanabaena sp. 'Roaring Creek']|uniref:hypothetical protein n=1 Tax=Pseudanabaena sp. 'Roaring Creek' TaxID=1681830 RepID=UPI0006D81180|nr:hypothetical protein [Pseudanabaena sp. 'Roaring Creek']
MTNAKSQDDNPEKNTSSAIDKTFTGIKPIVTTVESSTLPIQMPTISQELFEILAEKDALGLLKFCQSYDEKRFELAKQKEENRHQETIAKEKFKLESQTSSENIKKIALAVGLAFFALVLIYSGLCGNQDLPEKIFTLAVGGFGGAGVANSLKRQEEKI